MASSLPKDLSSRTRIYRTKLLDEFGIEGESKDQPVYSTSELGDGLSFVVVVFCGGQGSTDHLTQESPPLPNRT
jgi:hypothetical protein